MASDSQILAPSTMFTEDMFAFYRGIERFGEAVQVQTGRLFAADGRRLPDRARSAAVHLRRHPGADVGGIDLVTRAAAGTMVLGLLPAVPMTIVSALLMIVISRLTPAARPGAATLAKYFWRP